MRAVITALIILLFIAMYNLYVLNTLRHYLVIESDELKKILFHGAWALTALPLLIMGNSNNKSDLEIELRKMAQFVYAWTLSVILVNNMGWFKYPFYQIFAFNGVVFVVVLLLTINAYKHGLFNDGR